MRYPKSGAGFCMQWGLLGDVQGVLSLPQRHAPVRRPYNECPTVEDIILPFKAVRRTSGMVPALDEVAGLRIDVAR